MALFSNSFASSLDIILHFPVLTLYFIAKARNLVSRVRRDNYIKILFHLSKMRLKVVNYLELSPSMDAHVHLRSGEMSNLVVPEIRRGGVDTV